MKYSVVDCNLQEKKKQTTTLAPELKVAVLRTQFHFFLSMSLLACRVVKGQIKDERQ